MKSRKQKIAAALTATVCSMTNAFAMVEAVAVSSTEEYPEHGRWDTRYVQNATGGTASYPGKCRLKYNTEGQRVIVTSSSSLHAVKPGENVVRVRALPNKTEFYWGDTLLRASGDSQIFYATVAGGAEYTDYTLSAYTSNTANIFYAEGTIDNL